MRIPSTTPERVSPPDAVGAASLVATPRGPQWANVNHRPFAFRHRLADDPLFDLPRLAALARRAAERNADRFLRRKADADSRSLADRILHLDEREDWVKISYANELEPEYRRVHDALLEDFESRSDIPIRERMTWSGMTIFMNSPNFAVPYHFDHETNFLLQIRGTKDVDLFDGTDRSVLTEREIEHFYRGEPMAGRFRPELEARATRFVLQPGDAVHHPPLAPHRIFNRDAVAVSVSIFFSFADADRRAHVYQVNGFLRDARLQPAPPGRNASLDALKIGAMRAISRRKPATHHQALFSGVERLALPAKAARKLARATRTG